MDHVGHSAGQVFYHPEPDIRESRRDRRKICEFRQSLAVLNRSMQLERGHELNEFHYGEGAHLIQHQRIAAHISFLGDCLQYFANGRRIPISDGELNFPFFQGDVENVVWQVVSWHGRGGG